VVTLTSVDVASSRSVLGRTVTATTDVGEVAGNVAVNARVQGNIDLVTVPVRVGTTSVTSLWLIEGKLIVLEVGGIEGKKKRKKFNASFH
jgi:hypothetical protein